MISDFWVHSFNFAVLSSRLGGRGGGNSVFPGKLETWTVLLQGSPLERFAFQKDK